MLCYMLYFNLLQYNSNCQIFNFLTYIHCLTVFNNYVLLKMTSLNTHLSGLERINDIDMHYYYEHYPLKEKEYVRTYNFDCNGYYLDCKYNYVYKNLCVNRSDCHKIDKIIIRNNGLLFDIINIEICDLLNMIYNCEHYDNDVVNIPLFSGKCFSANSENLYIEIVMKDEYINHNVKSSIDLYDHHEQIGSNNNVYSTIIHGSVKNEHIKNEHFKFANTSYEYFSIDFDNYCVNDLAMIIIKADVNDIYHFIINDYIYELNNFGSDKVITYKRNEDSDEIWTIIKFSEINDIKNHVRRSYPINVRIESKNIIDTVYMVNSNSLIYSENIFMLRWSH